MRGCARSCSRRQRRPEHHLEPRAGPASACPATTAADSVPATVSPKQLPLHGPVNLYDRLLSFLLLFQLLLLLPLPGSSGKPLTHLTLARPQTLSSAPLDLRLWTHRLVFDFLQSCIALPSFAPAISLWLSSVPPPRSLLLEQRPSAPAGQWPPPPPSRVQLLPLPADDVQDVVL
jgi:hypothetical protein